METNKIVHIKQLITSVIAVIAVEIAFNLLMSKSLFHPMVMLGLTRIVQTAIIILIVLAQGKGLSVIGLEPSVMLHGFKRGLIWSASFGAVVFLGFVILFIFKIDPLALISSNLPEDQGDMILFFIVGGAMAPIAEETFFRGILYGFFRRWGAIIALLISSILFSLTHLAVSGTFIIQLIGGILFAVAYELEKSLVTPITIHVLGNLAIFTISTWS